MSKKIMLLNKALNNPDGLSIEEFRTLMRHKDGCWITKPEVTRILQAVSARQKWEG